MAVDMCVHEFEFPATKREVLVAACRQCGRPKAFVNAEFTISLRTGYLSEHVQQLLAVVNEVNADIETEYNAKGVNDGDKAAD